MELNLGKTLILFSSRTIQRKGDMHETFIDDLWSAAGSVLSLVEK